MGAQARRTARRRRLGAELKALREAAGVSAEQAARRIHGDNSKISRLENGRQRIGRLELEALLDLYRVGSGKLREGLTMLSAEGRRRNWWRQYGDIFRPDFREGLDLEADAVQLSAFQPLVVPGLLQTEAYAAAVLRGTVPGLGEEELKSHLAVRMSRQAVLDRRPPPHYACVLTEGALRQEIGGPKVLAAQLRHLVAMSKPPELTIQVLPHALGAHAGLSGAFVIYSYPEPMDLDVIGVECLDGSLFLEEDRPVERHRTAFEQLRSSALPARQSLDLISRIADEIDPP